MKVPHLPTPQGVIAITAAVTREAERQSLNPIADILPRVEDYGVYSCAVSCDYVATNAVSAASRFIESLRASPSWDITVTDAQGVSVVVRLDTKEILCQ